MSLNNGSQLQSAFLSRVDLIASQYNSSTKFKKWVDVYMNETTPLCNGICSLVQLFKVDAATGEWLNLIGRIVGQPRLTVDTAQLDIFGFEPDVTNFGFNEGVWTDGSYGAATIDSSDTIYRRMIKARALKNISKGTVAEIIRGITILSGGRTDFYLIDLSSPMQFGIQFNAAIDANTRVLLENYDLLPVGMGIKLTQVLD